MTLLTAFKVLLYRYSGQQDICVGTPVAGRNQHETEGLIGFFVNTLALRSHVSGEQSFRELLAQVKVTALEAYERQEIPFEKVVDAVVKERDISRSPLFQVMFDLGNTPEVPELKLGELVLSQSNQNNDTSKFELSLFMTATASGLIGSVEYNTDLYKETTILSMIDHFEELLGSIAAAPEQKIGRLRMLTAQEEHQLLNAFSGTTAAYPKDKSIVALFEEQAQKTPGAIAIVYEDTVITYRELNERSNRLARYLQKKGVKKETLVPVCIERSPGMIIGILGILKARGAYVPIDPEYPQDRITYMLEDTRAEVVLSSKESRERLKGSNAEVIMLDGDWEMISGQAATDLPDKPQPGQLAYVIYTSGSTGRPKGVMIEHRGVVSLVKGVDYVSMNERNTLLVTGSPSFDATTFEYWGMLLNGGRLILCRIEELLDSEFLKAAISSHIVNIMWFTSSWFNLLVENCPEVFAGLDTVLVGGEKLSERHIKKIRMNYPSLNLINGYGPTENTTFSLTYPITNVEIENSIPIGHPLSNRKAYVLNIKDQSLVPIGVSGEIYIGGAGLSRGYLNLPGLTAEKFIADPFSKDAQVRLYRTGDLGRWDAEGNIEYLGRIDEQVKIRGYRIELGEIESVLEQSGLVRQAVVLAKTDKQGTKRLVGYIVPEGTAEKGEIQKYLQEKLPEYMVPALWVVLDRLPLTPNGKTDKKALPDPEHVDLSGREYIAPGNETEAALAATWQELLGQERIGVHDNFFELGGDSILTIQVVRRMRRAGYVMESKDIFTHQTIGKLSAVIQGRAVKEETGEQGELSGTSGLLPIQSWYLESADRDISHYNQSLLLKISKSITAIELQAVADVLMSRHDALRLVFEKEEARWQQRYGAGRIQLQQADLRGTSKDKLGEQIRAICESCQRGLSVTEEGGLVRMAWMQTPEGEESNRLLLVIHHLGVDGVSWRILLSDMDQLLEGTQSGGRVALGSKGSSYRQWYNAQEQYSKSAALLRQQGYWEQIKSSYAALPEDYPYTGEVYVKEMAHRQVKLGKEQTRQLLQEVPRVYHTEINDLLLGALGAVLCGWSGQEGVVIGLEGHGREVIPSGTDISRTVGWFTSLYPVLLKTGPDAGSRIKEVKEELRRVPDKGLGYGVLKYISKSKELQGKDPWDILFNYLGQLDTAAGNSRWLSAADEPGGTEISGDQRSASKLSVNGHIYGGELLVRWSYSSRHYSADTISRIAEGYVSALKSLISHCLEQGKAGVVNTPADYGLGAEVSYEELDRFLEEPYLEGTRKDEIEDICRLSGLQQGMLFHGLYDEGSGSYIEQLSCDLSGVNREALLASWAAVIKKHSILRSAFYYDSFSLPVQCVYREAKLPVEELDYRGMEQQAQQEALAAYEAADRVKGFDFRAAPLMRLGLIRLDEQHTRMLWTSHHILFDGWSLPVLMEEFLSTYEQIISGRAIPETKEDRYEDYIRYLEGKDKDAEERYWRDYLQGVSQGTLLPFVKATAERTKGLGQYEVLPLLPEASAAARIHSYVQAHRLTVNTLVQGVWAILLQRYTGNKDVLYGVIVSGRPEELPGIEQRVGMYINTLPLQATVAEERDTVSWLQELQAGQAASREYQYTGLQDIQRWSGIKGDLFDSIIVFENYPVSKLIGSKKWSLQVENVHIREQTNYPLTISASSSEEDINISFSYNTELLEVEYVTAIRDQFEQVLFQVTEGKASALGDIRILTPSQERQLLEEFNDTQTAYPKDKSITELFEEQVIKTPGAIAVVYEDKQLTYTELNGRSNRLARYLREKGVKAETLVPICIERGLEMIVGILGILKAGGAYVPIDTEYPQERISYMLQDTKADIVLSSKGSREKLQGSTALVIELDGDWEVISKESAADLPVKPKPDHLVYVMYTSGSTGRPKGVMVEHQSVVRLVKTTNYINISESDAILSLSNFSFDGSVFDIFGALLNGASSIILPKEAILDLDLLSEAIDKNNISIFFITTALFNSLVDTSIFNFERLRYVLFGGELVSLNHVKRFKEYQAATKLVHVYGPTENTTFSSYHVIEDINETLGTIPIGRPISNTNIYILDKDQRLQSIGVAGEICVGGEGLARGYFERPELTEEKFVQDPYAQEISSRLYRTGDLGRWLVNGEIEFLGRIDDQVKIRGYRIEPGEIENILMQSGLVRKAVVLAKEDTYGTKRLISYIVAEGEFDKQAVQEYLLGKLPAYMIPSAYIELAEFPLTPNGKIDKNALPDPGYGDMTVQEYVAPQNETEQALALIWQELLGLEQVGIYDNFFELGGDSILAMRVVSSIKKRLLVSIPIHMLFQLTSISDLSKYIQINIKPDSQEKSTTSFKILDV